MNTPLSQTSSESLQQQVRKFLVHSFLYYQLDESLVSDNTYDALVQSLKETCQNAASSEVPYASIILPHLGQEASGFGITQYPPEIISTALHLLYQERYSAQYTFQEFVERRGFHFA